MKTIYKYPINTTGPTNIGLPRNSKVLYVGEQGGQVIIWAEVSLDEPGVEVHSLWGFGTGWPLDFGSRHFEANTPEFLGTVQMPSGLVWHYYID